MRRPAENTASKLARQTYAPRTLVSLLLGIRGLPSHPSADAHFIDGITMPFMMMRLAKKKTISGGMLTRTVAAMM